MKTKEIHDIHKTLPPDFQIMIPNPSPLVKYQAWF